MDTRQYHRQRRAKAKRAGICVSCNADPAQDGRTKCAGCLSVQSASRDPKPRIIHRGNFKTIFTPQQVAEIRRRREMGESQMSIAASFGCWPSTIHRIANRIAA